MPLRKKTSKNTAPSKAARPIPKKMEKTRKEAMLIIAKKEMDARKKEEGEAKRFMTTNLPYTGDIHGKKNNFKDLPKGLRKDTTTGFGANITKMNKGGEAKSRGMGAAIKGGKFQGVF